ncbi:MAG: RNA methyltransferase [Polyangia bacterium]
MLSRLDVVLVGTANPENLGGVARLCDNFALPSLTLVAPRAQPDDPRALVTGRMARARLAAARVTATLDEAVRDAGFVVGFSARRGGERPMTTLRALPSVLLAQSGRVALVFGPEDHGLANADVERCDRLVAIELPGALPSLNLTQAVAIALWELARPVDAAAPARAQATRAELDALVDHVARAGLFDDGDDGERQRVHLRRVLAAAALAPADVRALHGLVVRARAT